MVKSTGALYKTIDVVRAERLEQMIRRAGSAQELAFKAGMFPSYVSQIRSRDPEGKKRPKNIGSDVARRLETAMGLPHGWMDTPIELEEVVKHRRGTDPVELQTAVLTEAGELDLKGSRQVRDERFASFEPEAAIYEIEPEGNQLRLFSKDLVVAQPGLNPELGDLALLRCSPRGKADCLGQFLGFREDQVLLLTLAEKRQLRHISANDVSIMGKIVAILPH